MRYFGIVWGPWYPREQVGAVLPPTLVFIESRCGRNKPIYERELNKPDVHQMKGRWEDEEESNLIIQKT